MGVQTEQQAQTYRARPEPGQLVEVRRRQWVVADVDAARLDTGTPQHFVTLSSIDEDGLGEELEVVWEIEPGAQVIERAGHNDMWSNGRLFDLLTDPFDHDCEKCARRVRVPIADAPVCAVPPPTAA